MDITKTKYRNLEMDYVAEYGYNDIKFNDSQEKVKQVDGLARQIVIDNIMEEVYEHRQASVKLPFSNERLSWYKTFLQV